MSVIAKNQHGYLKEMKVVLRPQPGIQAIYTDNRDEAMTFASECGAMEVFRQNGWNSIGIDWDFNNVQEQENEHGKNQDQA